MIPVALALGSAVLWGVADFLGGLKTRSLPLAVVAVHSQATGLVLVLGLLAAAGMPATEPEVIGWGVMAGSAYVLGLAAFYRGLATGRMSLVAPLAGMSAAVPVAVGAASGEALSAVQVAGVVVAVAGIALAARERDAAGSLGATTRLALALGAIAALGIGVNLVGVEAAVAGRPASALLWVLAVTRFVALLAWILLSLGTGGGGALRRLPPRSLVALGAFDLLANVLFGLAVRESLLTLAAVLASLHPVFTVLLSRVVLKEPLRPVQQAGVALAVAGVALLSG